MSNKLTKTGLLLSTLEYYTGNINRRCANGVGCYYNSAEIGKAEISDGCAIGRYMTKRQKLLATFCGQYVGGLKKELMPKRLAHLPIYFLGEIQRLHDSSDNWCAKGLSKKGKKAVNSIIEGNGLNEKKFSKYLTT